MYRLISATPSPYARKVRISLAEKAIPFELITEVPWNSDTQTPLHNPLEKLPVLICADGTSWYESRLILEYLEVMHPDPALLPADPALRLAAKRFEVLADGVCDAFVLIFMERNRDPVIRSAEWEARQQRKIEGGLREVARLVGDRDYCVGNAFSLADIAVGTVLRYLDIRFSEHPWRQLYPGLVALSNRLEQRPSFAGSVPTPQVIRDKVA